MRNPVFLNTVVLFAARITLTARAKAARKAALGAPDVPAHPEPAEGR